MECNKARHKRIEERQKLNKVVLLSFRSALAGLEVVKPWQSIVVLFQIIRKNLEVAAGLRPRRLLTNLYHLEMWCTLTVWKVLYKMRSMT